MLNFLNDMFMIFGTLLSSITTFPISEGVTVFNFLAGGLVIVLLIKFFLRR